MIQEGGGEAGDLREKRWETKDGRRSERAKRGTPTSIISGIPEIFLSRHPAKSAKFCWLEPKSFSGCGGPAPQQYQEKKFTNNPISPIRQRNTEANLPSSVKTVFVTFVIYSMLGGGFLKKTHINITHGGEKNLNKRKTLESSY